MALRGIRPLAHGDGADIYGDVGAGVAVFRGDYLIGKMLLELFLPLRAVIHDLLRRLRGVIRRRCRGRAFRRRKHRACRLRRLDLRYVHTRNNVMKQRENAEHKPREKNVLYYKPPYRRLSALSRANRRSGMGRCISVRHDGIPPDIVSVDYNSSYLSCQLNLQ